MRSLWNKIKKKVNKFLASIAEENKKSFGSEKLDCCQLNRNTVGKTK